MRMTKDEKDLAVFNLIFFGSWPTSKSLTHNENDQGKKVPCCFQGLNALKCQIIQKNTLCSFLIQFLPHKITVLYDFFLEKVPKSEDFLILIFSPWVTVWNCLLYEKDVFLESAQNWRSHIFINMSKKRHSFAVFHILLLFEFKSRKKSCD
jgi:hypothetical protein